MRRCQPAVPSRRRRQLGRCGRTPAARACGRCPLARRSVARALDRPARRRISRCGAAARAGRCSRCRRLGRPRRRYSLPPLIEARRAGPDGYRNQSRTRPAARALALASSEDATSKRGQRRSLPDAGRDVHDHAAGWRVRPVPQRVDAQLQRHDQPVRQHVLGHWRRDRGRIRTASRGSPRPSRARSTLTARPA